jgi:S-adenosylmethionine hydrolase
VPQLVTLTTDFGLKDAYVAAMKGAMLQVEPSLRIVDVTHLVDPQDVMGAAFVLRQVIPFYPEGTVHLAVVDPDVGSARLPIAGRFDGHLFVGPDTGLLSLLLRGSEPEQVVILDRRSYWRTEQPATTFNARDVFGPVAAHLASGRALDEVGTPTDTFRRLHWAHPLADDEGVQGFVVHIDRFGNCVTNISREVLANDPRSLRAKCYVGSTIIEGIHNTYTDVPQGEPLALVGSSNHLEVGVHCGDAASLLTIHKGSPVSLVYGDEWPKSPSDLG